MSADPRDEEIQRLTYHLAHARSVRLHMLGIITLAWLAGFLTSFALLHLGLTSMAVRYAIATACGYGAFVFAVRMWLLGSDAASQANDDGSRRGPRVNLGGLGRLGGEATKKGGDALFTGGRSGGAGASALWDTNTPAIQPLFVPAPDTSGASGSGFSGLGKIKMKGKNAGAIVAVVLIAIAIAVVGRVVWSAPNLIAEMLVDGALAGGALRGVARAHQRREIDVIEHTWIPALIVFVLMIALGVTAQSFVPTAVSIGDLFR